MQMSEHNPIYSVNKGQGHSDLTLVHDILPCPNVYICTKYHVGWPFDI